MEHTYLDIYPSQRIARQLNEEDPACQFIQKTISDVKAYIEIMEDEEVQYFKVREGEKIGASETYKFFRSHERTRNTKFILQYLTTFLAKLPLEKDIELEGRTVDPFKQLKSFTLFNINLIKDKDVNAAILREHEKLGLLTDTNLWYYRGQIDKSHKMLREVVESVKSATVPDYHKLFSTLQRLSTFWFSVRNEEIKRVRKSDLYIYKLARYLLEKYRS
ncbi:MAG: hypothetical protein JSV88_20415 [Candidatus Aminicenantes bacterium]|nr:MAG: hypothetical protein JSV88_20415 [Candidatus Aminicenantes bacterium]